MAAKKETTEKLNDVYLTGKVVRAYYGTSRKDDTEKYRFTIFDEKMPYEKIDAFDSSSSKYTPTWFKDLEGYVNLSSMYDIPVRFGNKDMTFDEWLKGELTPPNSIVTVRVRQKQGAVYPVAILVKEDGFTENPFDGFETTE